MADSKAIIEAMDNTEISLAVTPIESGILREVMGGASADSIALSLGLPVGIVRTFLRKKEVKDYIKEVRTTAAEVDQMMLADTLRGVVTQRIEDCEGDLSLITKKDTLDVIKVLAEMNTGTLKAVTEGEKKNDVLVNIYNAVMD